MHRCLVVANQTLGGLALRQAVQERIERGDHVFHVLVPMTPPEHETDMWIADDPQFHMPPALIAEDASAIEAARRRSEHRLGVVLQRIREAGGEADGEVGDSDPFEAVRSVLESGEFDEIIVSMLPARLSRWLRMDLPSRLARTTDVPVTVIKAEE